MKCPNRRRNSHCGFITFHLRVFFIHSFQSQRLVVDRTDSLTHSLLSCRCENSHCLESGVTFSMRAMKFSRNSVLLLDSSRSLQYSLRNRRSSYNSSSPTCCCVSIRSTTRAVTPQTVHPHRTTMCSTTAASCNFGIMRVSAQNLFFKLKKASGDSRWRRKMKKTHVNTLTDTQRNKRWNTGVKETKNRCSM